MSGQESSLHRLLCTVFCVWNFISLAGSCRLLTTPWQPLGGLPEVVALCGLLQKGHKLKYLQLQDSETRTSADTTSSLHLRLSQGKFTASRSAVSFLLFGINSGVQSVMHNLSWQQIRVAHLTELRAKRVFQKCDCHQAPRNNGANHVGAQQQGVVSRAPGEATHVDGGDGACQLAGDAQGHSPAAADLISTVVSAMWEPVIMAGSKRACCMPKSSCCC